MFSETENRTHLAHPAARVSVALTVAFGVGASTVPPAWAIASGALCALAFLAAFAFAERPALAAGAYVAALEARRIARLVVAPRCGAHAAPARFIPTQRTRIGVEAVTA